MVIKKKNGMKENKKKKNIWAKILPYPFLLEWASFSAVVNRNDTNSTSFLNWNRLRRLSHFSAFFVPIYMFLLKFWWRNFLFALALLAFEFWLELIICVFAFMLIRDDVEDDEFWLNADAVTDNCEACLNKFACADIESGLISLKLLFSLALLKSLSLSSLCVCDLGIIYHYFRICNKLYRKVFSLHYVNNNYLTTDSWFDNFCILFLNLSIKP